MNNKDNVLIKYIVSSLNLKIALFQFFIESCTINSVCCFEKELKRNFLENSTSTPKKSHKKYQNFIPTKYKLLADYHTHVTSFLQIDPISKKVLDVIILIYKQAENNLNTNNNNVNINKENFLFLSASQLDLKLPGIKVENPLLKMLSKFTIKVFKENSAQQDFKIIINNNLYIFWNISNYFIIYKINLSNLSFERVFRRDFQPGIYLSITECEYINKQNPDEYKILIYTKQANKLFELTRCINKSQEVFLFNERKLENLIKLNKAMIPIVNWSDYKVRKFIFHKNLYLIEAQKNVICSIRFKKSKLKPLANIESDKAKFFLPFYSLKSNTNYMVVDELISNGKVLVIKNYKTLEKENNVECELIQKIFLECEMNLEKKNSDKDYIVIGEYEFFLIDNENFLIIFYEIEIIYLVNLQEQKQNKNVLLIENIFELSFDSLDGTFFDFSIKKNNNTGIPQILEVGMIYEGYMKKHVIYLNKTLRIKRMLNVNIAINPQDEINIEYLINECDDKEEEEKKENTEKNRIIKMDISEKVDDNKLKGEITELINEDKSKLFDNEQRATDEKLKNDKNFKMSNINFESPKKISLLNGNILLIKILIRSFLKIYLI